MWAVLIIAQVLQALRMEIAGVRCLALGNTRRSWPQMGRGCWWTGAGGDVAAHVPHDLVWERIGRD
ncbi:MAG: hypothetical protein U0531_09560 [Dehalococcoidia bacterium]